MQGTAMSRSGFRSLVVWQKAKSLAVSVYKLTEQGKLAKDFGLRDQMRRSAVSICSNIAEGNERDTDKEFVRFLYVAKGSLAELLTQLEIAYEVHLISPEDLQPLNAECNHIANMLGALIRSRSQTPL